MLYNIMLNKTDVQQIIINKYLDANELANYFVTGTCIEVELVRRLARPGLPVCADRRAVTSARASGQPDADTLEGLLARSSAGIKYLSRKLYITNPRPRPAPKESR